MTSSTCKPKSGADASSRLCAIAKAGGEGRGAGFLQWLREREISKTRAYGLIQLAESAQEMLGEGVLEESSVNQFSKRAFMETARRLLKCS